MKLLLLVGLAVQLPFAATSSSPYGVPPPPAIISPPGPSETQSRTNDDTLRQLFATTKSVMKRRGDAAPSAGLSSDNSSANPPAIRDQQLVQASHNQIPSGAAGDPAGKAEKTGSGFSPDNSNADVDATRSGAAVDAATRASANASAGLLAAALAPPAANGLDGRPVSLADALGRSTTSVRRLEVAALYWKLALAIADYHWSLDESQQLGALPGNEDAVDAPLLATAQAAAQARQAEAKAAAVTLQQELADAIGQPTQPLPLTVEQPLVGPYRTEFDTIFAGRAAPGRSRAIHRALPHWREAVDLRAAAVQAAASAVPAAEAVFFGKQTTGVATVLIAHRALSEQRRAFLNAVRGYNAEIVEYASYVAGPTTSTATLVSMLTRSKPNKLSDSGGSASTFGAPNEPTLAPPRDPNVQQAAGEEEIPDGQSRGGEWTGAAKAAPSEPSAPAEPATNLKLIEEGGKD